MGTTDVLMVYPKTGYDIKNVSVELPLASLSIASVFVDRYNVKIIDQRTDTGWKQRLEKEAKKSPLFVGVSSMTGSQIKYGLELSKVAKESNPRVKVVWGGIHTTLLPEQTVRHPLIDIGIVGEGEVTIQKIARSLEQNKQNSQTSQNKRLEKIKGIVFKREGRIINTGIGELPDINRLPALPYHLVDVEKHVKSGGMIKKKGDRILPFVSSRGCPHGCRFCCNPKISKRCWRGMRPERAYGLIQELVERFKLDVLKFHDENFLTDPKRVEKISALIGGRFRWSVQARMDELAKIDLGKLERNGLSMVEPGIESGSDRILKLIGKGENKQTMLQANKKLAKTSIVANYNFMCGFPTETRGEVLETVDFSLQLLKENPGARLTGFYIFTPYPGTELFDLAVEQGFKPPKSLGGWSRFSRQHLETPWIQDRLPMLQNIMYTSKFVDGKRLTHIFGNTILPKDLVEFVGRYYRKKWEKHRFKRGLDIILMRLITKHLYKWG